MKSIQGRLTAWLAVTMVVLSAATGGGLFAYLHAAMLREFDASLALRANALQSLITQRADGSYDVDVDPARLPEYRHAGFREYFRVTDAAGNVLVTSTHEPVDVGVPFPDDAPRDLDLPQHTHARAMWQQFVPQTEHDDLAKMNGPAEDRAAVTLLVARDRRRLDTAMARVAAAIGAAVAVLSLVTLAATVVIVRTGLGTLRGVTTEMAAIDFTRPGVQFAAASVPDELVPVVDRFNEMLDRIAATLTREKRFTADVAHELRTPIAELRSAAEVALRSPEDWPAARRTVTQAHDIALQMQTVVVTLLAIVRQTTPADHLDVTAVPLWPLIDRVVRGRPVRDGHAGLGGPADDGLLVRADASLLRAILENVIGNAFDYSAGGTPVAIAAVADPERVRLSIENQHAGLTSDDLAHVFEPFWRKDAARSDGSHAGLGLTLTRTYCDAMGIGLAASLRGDGRFCIQITLPRVTRAVAPAPADAPAVVAGHADVT